MNVTIYAYNNNLQFAFDCMYACQKNKYINIHTYASIYNLLGTINQSIYKLKHPNYCFTFSSATVNSI